MKKKSLIFCMIAVSLLGGCRRDSESEDVTNKPMESSSKEKTVESSSESEISEKNENELFDQLPEEVKIVLYANTVDSRIADSPGLEGLTLAYKIVGDNLFLQLTSDSGSGHPIYHLILEKDGVKPLQAISYMGGGADVPYLEIAVKEDSISKKQLYDDYLSNKENFELDAQKVEQRDQLDEQFRTFLEYGGVGEKKIDGTVAVNIPNEELILQYFTKYIMDDFGLSQEEYKQQAHYGVDEKGDQMIRYVGGKGAYTEVEGNRVIYKEYSFGGVSEDGTVEKSDQLQAAFYDFVTGEHGKI